MTAWAYYNEHDGEKAEALRWLMRDGWIAPGEVDQRDIRDVVPTELSGFAQCHFFAGIGLWSVAARRAGIPDDYPFWSGSCPCQPFSAAGAGAGIADERHLWPHWHWIIAQRRPATVVGEQVASRDGLGWLDLVCVDMEGTGYSGGALDLCSAGFGAPNIRQRLYMCWVADANRRERGGVAGGEGCRPDRAATGRKQGDSEPEPGRKACGVGNAASARSLPAAQPGEDRCDEGARSRDAGFAGSDRDGSDQCAGRPVRHPLLDRPAQPFWSDVDWLQCRDPDGPKLRPVERGSFPLAPGYPGRNGELRAYGDAINLEVATAFLEAVKPDLPGVGR